MSGHPSRKAKGPQRSGGNVLVLGGGGARGFAHLGVLRVLEDLNFKIDRIVGVSIGALVGACYCQNPDVESVTESVRNYIESRRFSKYLQRMGRASLTRQNATGHPDQDSSAVDLEDGHFLDSDENGHGGWFGRLRDYLKATMAFHRVVVNRSILSNKPMEDCLRAVCNNIPMEDLEIPLTIVAADLMSGSRVRLESGDLHSAVVGSTALPGIFPPVERGDHLLADYGVVCSIPVSTALRYRPQNVIAVDLSSQVEPREDFSSGLDIINRMEEIGSHLFKEHISSLADVVIKPAVSNVDWAAFYEMDDIMEQGALATEAVLPTLASIIRQGSRT